VHVPAAPARPRREISRARGDAQEEEQAAAATRRDAMAMDSFTKWLSLALVPRRLSETRLQVSRVWEFIWAGLGRVETSPISDSSFVMLGFLLQTGPMSQFSSHHHLYLFI